MSSPSIISIYPHVDHITREKLYLCNVRGICGGGFRNALAGHTAEQAAATANLFVGLYGLRNRAGFLLFAPKSIKELLPQYLHGSL